MKEHVFSRVMMARTLDGYQVWIDGSSMLIAMVETEREARMIVRKMKGIGTMLEPACRPTTVGRHMKKTAPSGGLFSYSDRNVTSWPSAFSISASVAPASVRMRMMTSRKDVPRI